MSMLVQTDGKVLVVGQYQGGLLCLLCIARMKADWSGLDDTYDGSSAGDGASGGPSGRVTTFVVGAALQRTENSCSPVLAKCRRPPPILRGATERRRHA